MSFLAQRSHRVISRRLWSVRLLTVPLMLAFALLTSTVIVSPVHAADGRAISPEGELDALYRHGLGRAADGGGWQFYTERIHRDCRWGVLRASYEILTSPEALNRWRTPENLVGAIYAGLLDRAPDPDGFATWVNVTRVRGFPLAVTNVLASPEYRGRLNRICAGREGREPAQAAVLSPTESLNVYRGLWDASKWLAAGCGIQLVAFVTPIQGAHLALPIVQKALKLAKAAEAYDLIFGTCRAWYEIFSAAKHGWSLARLDYPVFWRMDTQSHHDLWPPDECTTWIRVGPNPSRPVTYKAQYPCGYGFDL